MRARSTKLVRSNVEDADGELMVGMVKVRLMGLPVDVERTTQALRNTLRVVEESPDYPNRGRSAFVRRYLTVMG